MGSCTWGFWHAHGGSPGSSAIHTARTITLTQVHRFMHTRARTYNSTPTFSPSLNPEHPQAPTRPSIPLLGVWAGKPSPTVGPEGEKLQRGSGAFSGQLWLPDQVPLGSGGCIEGRRAWRIHSPAAGPPEGPGPDPREELGSHQT
jgi:hypothetical protein